VNVDLALPAGHRLVSLAEAPSMDEALGEHNGAVWPDFMLRIPCVAGRCWHHLDEDFAGWQVMLLDPAGRIAAALNSAPLWWDGTAEGLPDGWDAQLELTIAQHASGVAPNTLGALQIVVAPERQGEGLAGLMVGTMRAMARAQGLGALIACVRPTGKERYPTIPIERYARWTRSDGLPLDPWIRLHARLGGCVVRPAPRSMAYRASVATWEALTGMAFPESGEYVVPRAASLVAIDREHDEGVYFDPNVWMVHDLG
jgi:GNAT superfamily N-acetyltransferase